MYSIESALQLHLVKVRFREGGVIMPLIISEFLVHEVSVATIIIDIRVKRLIIE